MQLIDRPSVRTRGGKEQSELPARGALPSAPPAAVDCFIFASSKTSIENSSSRHLTKVVFGSQTGMAQRPATTARRKHESLEPCHGHWNNCSIRRFSTTHPSGPHVFSFPRFENQFCSSLSAHLLKTLLLLRFVALCTCYVLEMVGIRVNMHG